MMVYFSNQVGQHKIRIGHGVAENVNHVVTMQSQQIPSGLKTFLTVFIAKI